MTTTLLTELEEVADPSDESPQQGACRVDTPRVLKGMFVVELDRPWTDTPLPQNGLLVDTDEELQAIRRHCRFVMVDPARSLPELLEAIEAAAVLSYDRNLFGDDAPSPAGRRQPPGGSSALEQAAVPPRASAGSAWAGQRQARRRDADSLGGAPRLRDDVRPSSAARARVFRLVRDPGQAPAGRDGALSRVRGWLGLGEDSRATGSQAGEQRSRDALAALRGKWGDPIGAADYGDGDALRASLALARPVHARLAAAADQAVRQVRHGAALAVEPLADAADEFAASVASGPDAMRWLGALYTYATPNPNPSVSVALRLVEFGRSMGMPHASLRELALLGLLADLGKSLLPRDRLEHPGVLAPHDYALMQQHVTIGLDLLSHSSAVPEAVLRGIAEHHERLDGTGYPRGLRADAIGLYGRMAAIVDSVCALTTARPYANPLSVEDALAALSDWSGTLFCRDLTEWFIRATGAYPIGTLVELASGEVAAVVDRRPENRMQPKLLLMTAADKGPLGSTRDQAGSQSRNQTNGRAPVRIARALPAAAFGLQMKDYYALPG
ncbi:MAG: HD-GYP domain-containing protein [Burkholderiales bacterium]|nr:MAG: HD-GYP domain-containing protein [Burkholderiales bacterium]